MITYKLSKETRRNLNVSTGHDYAVLTTRPIGTFRVAEGATTSHLVSSHPRVIKPRGSIYLQLGRVLSMSKVRKSIFKE